MATTRLAEHGGAEIAAQRAWFCVRSQPKREHIAAAHLARLEAVETFNPRLRRRVVTRRGLLWLTESLFPSYLFVRFDVSRMLDPVRYTAGVSSIVHFGREGYPVVPETVINDLKREFPSEEMTLPMDDLFPGRVVTLAEGAFYGLQGVVLRALPARQRVEVLLEMLGHSAKVEVPIHSVMVDKGVAWPPSPALAGARIAAR